MTSRTPGAAAETTPRPWVYVCRSKQLASQRLVEISSRDRQGVVWRGASGRLGAVDAYCPHMGVHLADGTIEGEGLVCPFHGWRFEHDGQCTTTAYDSTKPPPKASARAWEIREQGGSIWARAPLGPAAIRRRPAIAGTFPEGWYKIALSRALRPGATQARHYFGRTVELSRATSGILTAHIAGAAMPCCESGGIVMVWYGPDRPTFAAPDYHTYGDPSRVWRRYSEVVPSSLWDIAENPFDYAHLSTVHHLNLLSKPVVETEDATLHLRLRTTAQSPIGQAVLDRLLPISVDIRSFGLGLTDTHFQPRRLLSELWIIGCNTPVDDRRTEYTLIFVSNRGARSRPLQRARHHFLAEAIWRATEMERLVWQRKQYLAHPRLTRYEGGVGRFRRWAKQFRCS